MNSDRQSAEGESRAAWGLAIMCVLSLVFIPLIGILLHVDGIIYLLVVTVGFLIGIVYSRWKYPSWARLMKSPQSGLVGSKRYSIGLFLFIFVFVTITRALEPLPSTIFLSIVIGGLASWAAGAFVWSVALYLRRNSGVNE